MVSIKTPEEIEILREGGHRLAQILKKVAEATKAGVLTSDLDILVSKLIKEADGKSAFLGYRPMGAPRAFPANMCISVNNEVVHGIPTEYPKKLRDGDVVALDMGFIYKNLITDSAISIVVGGPEKADKSALKLLEVGKKALDIGINSIKAGTKSGDIGDYVEKAVKGSGFNLTKDLGGHGVGYKVHEDPFIPNFSMPNQGVLLKPGMVIAIEPILNEGSGKIIGLSDGYTYITADKKRSVHFEHTVYIREDGTAEILTI